MKADTPRRTMDIETARLRLVLKSADEVRAEFGAMDPEHSKELSPAWLELVKTARDADPWIHGFTIRDRQNNTTVGQCGFKGPPGPDGAVEIAYAIEADHQGKGFATEAAAALAHYALSSGFVRTVRAHTLRERNASASVLTKCGFRNIGDVLDPDDGLVWRWELVKA